MGQAGGVQDLLDGVPLDLNLLEPTFQLDEHPVDPAGVAVGQVVMKAAELGIPVPAFSSALAYFDSYRRERLPANMIQAQRDYSGAHTYERVDRKGSFHTDWLNA